MRCHKPDCEGELENGVCQTCGNRDELRSGRDARAPGAQSEAPAEKADSATSQAVTDAVSGANPTAVPAASIATQTAANVTAGMSSAGINSVEEVEAARAAKAKKLFDDERAARSNASIADRRTPEMKLQKVSQHLKVIDGKDALLQASEALTNVVPDKYEAWRAQADLWLAAIRQLENRQLSPDDSVKLMGIPLIEKNLRDAAEEALRQCAHFAPSFEQRVSLIDEANSIRNKTWF